MCVWKGRESVGREGGREESMCVGREGRVCGGEEGESKVYLKSKAQNENYLPKSR